MCVGGFIVKDCTNFWNVVFAVFCVIPFQFLHSLSLTIFKCVNFVEGSHVRHENCFK